MKRFRSLFLFTLILMTYFPSTLHAALFEQLAVSALGGSMANTVTAYPEEAGALSIHYNPAGLAEIPGTRFDNGLGIVETYREVTFRQAIDPLTGKLWAPFGQNNIPEFNNGIDPLNGAKGKQSSGFMIIPYIDFDLPYLFTPSMGISYKPPQPQYSRWTFGFAQFAPFGAGLKNEANSPLSFLGQEAWFVRMSFLTPAIAYKFSDTVSIGASVGIGPSMFMLETNLRSPNTMSALTGALGNATKGLEIPVVSELTYPPPWFNGGMDPYNTQGHLELQVEDYITTSYNLGLLWRPYDWFSFGACYQSESEANMTGVFKLSYGSQFRRTVDWFGRSPLTIVTAAIFDLPTASVPYQKGNVTMDLTWPARLQMGIMLNPIKQVKFTCDANWTDWAVQPNWKFVYDQKIQLFRFARMLGYRYSTDTQVITQDFKDTWNLSYGCEIKPDAKHTLRFGYDPRPTSVRNNLFGPLPFPNINIYSAGIGIVVDDKPKPSPKNFNERLQQLNNPNEINITVSYIKMADKTVLNNTSTNLNSTNFTNIVYNPYAGLDYTQKMHLWWFAIDQVFKW